jgi:hypothetical protein
MKRIVLFALLGISTLALGITTAGKSDDEVSREKWEYLVVSGPSTTNFSPTGNSKMRKSEGSFGKEAFVLEQHLDKLGAEGWQLVTIVGQERDPVFYFRRPK